MQEFNSKNIIAQEDYEKYYLLDEQALKDAGLDELIGKYDGYFLVNYDNYEVIYTNGYENSNGIWCYKISDLNKKNEVKGFEKELIETVAEAKQAGETEQENNEQSTNSEQSNNQNENNTENQSQESKTEEPTKTQENTRRRTSGT